MYFKRHRIIKDNDFPIACEMDKKRYISRIDLFCMIIFLEENPIFDAIRGLDNRKLKLISRLTNIYDSLFHCYMILIFSLYVKKLFSEIIKF